MVKLGLVMGSDTPRAIARPFTKVVLPAPTSPMSSKTIGLFDGGSCRTLFDGGSCRTLFDGGSCRELFDGGSCRTLFDGGSCRTFPSHGILSELRSCELRGNPSTSVTRLASVLPSSIISCSEAIFMLSLYHENLYFWYIWHGDGAAGVDGEGGGV